MATASNKLFTLTGPCGEEHQSGSAVTLSCHLSPELSAVNMEIRWFKGTDCLCLYKNRQVTEGRGYEDRVGLFTEELERGNVSLQIRHCRWSDEGDYLCQVTNGNTTEECMILVAGVARTLSRRSVREEDKAPIPNANVSQSKINVTKKQRIEMRESALLIEMALSGVNVGSSDPLVEDPGSASTQHPYREHSILAEKFTPEISETASATGIKTLYRFSCPHEDLFQCKLTNLVFEMEGKGTLLYKIKSWERKKRFLYGLGLMRPAGPLYSIECLEGSLGHLHLPHCEIQNEENKVELVVAHISGGKSEIIQPLKVTNTHVIISIQGLSLFGLLKKKVLHPRPIKAQVLLFYTELGDDPKRTKLHIHLLAANVPVKEVQDKHQGVVHFETSCSCQLIPGKAYRPFCDPYVSEPKVGKFHYDYGPNYHPTFVVFLQDEKVTVSLLDKNGTEVWEPHQVLLTAGKPDQSTKIPLTMEEEAEFVDKHRTELIRRVSSVMEIVDCLRSRNMITVETYSTIHTTTPSQEQMRILYDALESGGVAVKAEFYKVLKKKQPFLVKDLEAGSSKA